MHEMKLYKESFDRLINGEKTREYRLYDEKRKLIKVGDTIKFIRLPDKDKVIYADVSKIEIFDNWYDCYNKHFEEDFSKRYKSVQEVVDDTYTGGYYTKEESDKYGCICITLSNVRENI